MERKRPRKKRVSNLIDDLIMVSSAHCRQCVPEIIFEF